MMWISDKKKKRNIANVKGRPCIMTTWSIHQKDITILCVHAPNRASKYLKHKLIEQKEKKKNNIYIYIYIYIHTHTIIIENFETSLSVIDRQ